VSLVDDCYCQQDCVRVMGAISKAVAAALGAPTAPQQAAIDGAVASIAALDAAGETPPGDLTAQTDAFVQGVRDEYEAAKDEADALLALSAEVQAAIGLDVTRVTAYRDMCVTWIAAIDAEWTPA